MNNAKLSELFGGKTRLALLRVLFLNPSRKFAPKELAQMGGLDSGNVARLVKKWTELGIVRKTVDGRNVAYQASDDPLFSGLIDMVRRSDAILDDIRAALPDDVEVAVIFGSTARGEERADSDIDVLALGPDLSSIRVNAALKPVGRKHDRVIHVSVHSQEEFEQLLRDEDSFAQNVVGQKTISVKGDFHYAIS